MAPTNELRLAIGLPLRNTAALTNLLREIYDPASPQFHHYLKPAEFTARFGPTPEDYTAVLHFAQTNGFAIIGTHSNRLVVDVTGKASDVERAFHVRLNSYRHPKEKRNFFAPDAEPSVDASLSILHVSGLDDYALPHSNLHAQPASLKSQASPRAGSAPGGLYIGNDFRRAYVPDTLLTGAGQSVGLLQFDAFYPVDITNYLNLIGLTNNAPQLVIVPVDGGVASPGIHNDEVALDIEMVLSMAPGVSNIYVYEAPNRIAFWDDLLNRMAEDDSANQLSCSWGGGGPDANAEEIFQQMASQGQSFFNASGDSDAFTDVIPFPSESPNITQVGGTTLTTDDNGNYVSETVWNWGESLGPLYNGTGSSGGISQSVPIPPWQLGIDMTTNLGSTTFRNIPDVALTGDDVYVCYDDGANALRGGTSCAAPLWAAFMALVNEQSVTAARPPAGFINPAVYAIGGGTNYAGNFHDTTAGDNYWLNSPTNFPATTGYDLCTGWGTPVGQGMITTLAGPPEPLEILPDTAFRAYGVAGGPFWVAAQNFALTNFSAASLDWFIINPCAWLDISTTNGTLAVAGQTLVTFSLNSDADSLAPGTYVATIGFTNQTSGILQTRQVILQVADPLQLQPGNGFSASGPVGGPFVPACFALALTNSSMASIDWSLGGASSWLAASANGGSLAANGSTNIVLQFSGVDTFPAAIYSTVLAVTNLTWSGVQSVAVQVAIAQSIVQNGGFETGDFTAWTLADSSTPGYVYDGVDPLFPDIVHSGNYGVFMGEVGYLATLTQTLATTPNQLYDLSFWVDNTVSGNVQEFAANWNGTNVLDLVAPPVLTWTNFQFLVTATGTNTDLQLAAQNDPNYFGLDDVSVTPVPPVVFGAANLNGSDLQFSWYALAGLKYEVQFTTNLAVPGWQPLTDVIASTNVCWITDTNIVNGDCQRFYRLVLEP